jgi:hypothetical protein
MKRSTNGTFLQVCPIPQISISGFMLAAVLLSVLC